MNPMNIDLLLMHLMIKLDFLRNLHPQDRLLQISQSLKKINT